MIARILPWRSLCLGVTVPRIAMLMVFLLPASLAFSAQADGDVAEPAGEVVVADSDAHGAEDAHGEGPALLTTDLGAAVWNLLIFLLVLFVLGMFVWPQILAGLQSREDKIQSDMRHAELSRVEAQAALSDYQRQLDEAQEKIKEMFAEARRDAEQTGTRIVEEAKADAERQRARALADIEAAKTTAITELANQTSDLAISLARQVVGRELNPQDHADLIRQSLDRLPSHN